MSNQVCCPHCLNAVSDTDTTCINCGEAIRKMSSLADVCLSIGVPIVVDHDGVECVISAILCTESGIRASYATSRTIEETEGVLH